MASPDKIKDPSKNALGGGMLDSSYTKQIVARVNRDFEIYVGDVTDPTVQESDDQVVFTIPRPLPAYTSPSILVVNSNGSPSWLQAPDSTSTWVPVLEAGTWKFYQWVTC